MFTRWIKNTFWALIVATFVAGFCATALLARANDNGSAAKPDAVFPATTYKFGKIHEGHDVRHDFIVENKGQAPLIIHRVASS